MTVTKDHDDEPDTGSRPSHGEDAAPDSSAQLTATAKTSEFKVDDRDTWREFYLLQFSRIEQHENSRLQVSNFVLAASVVGLGLGVSAAKGRSGVTSAIFLVFVAIVNALCVIWHAKSHKWVEQSRVKADQILAVLAPEAARLQNDVETRESQAALMGSAGRPRRTIIRTQNLLILIHSAISVAATAIGLTGL